MDLSYKEFYEMFGKLIESNELLCRENRELRKENQLLKERMQHLEERLRLDSRNSSKPPSSDQKKNKRAPRGGAKRGHPGRHRKPFPQEQVTQRVVSKLAGCPHCGSQDLCSKKSVFLQQVDLPPIKLEITEIERQRAQCKGCHRSLLAPFPSGYDQTAFGPKLTAFVGMCSSVYRLSKRSIQELLRTAFGITLSLGTIPRIEKRVSEGMKVPYEELFAQIKEAPIGCIDETTFRQQAKTRMVWTAVTQTACFFRILPTRGLDSLSQIRPRGHPGITISDRYQVYAYANHQYCLAHIRRDFAKFAQREGIDGFLAKRALFVLQEIFRACYLPRETMRRRVGYRKRQLRETLDDAFANGSESFSRFADRMLDCFEKLFLFTRYHGVDCTNNAAERALRHIVLWRKTSYGTQSTAGSQFLERTLSLWMTLKKQGRQLFPFLQQAYKATFDPSVPVPTL